jgi:uncharacterized protein (DUF1015 family)
LEPRAKKSSNVWKIRYKPGPMRIRPFPALRPTPTIAAELASQPYDVGELTEARREAQANPCTFLHVERPEVDLPDTFRPGDDHRSAAEHLARFQREGWLVREKQPRLYLYRQQQGAHVQTGLVACCHVEDYWADVIKKHEKTKKPVEDQRAEHVLACRANTGPIFLLHRDPPGLAERRAAIAATAPLTEFTANDGVRHTVWTIDDPAPFVEAFGHIPCAYVADGHHRAAAAARAGRALREKNPAHHGGEEYNWFLACLFPADELRILAYHRMMRDLNGLSAAAFLDQVRGLFTLTVGAPLEPAHPREATLFLDGHRYGLRWDAPAGADPVSALDVSVLQNRLLGPVLGVDDPRTNPRIGYLGGFGAAAELERRVATGEAVAAFALYPTTVDQLMAISDAGQIMPPKSTWFEPKLRSGLFVHALDG